MSGLNTLSQRSMDALYCVVSARSIVYTDNRDGPMLITALQYTGGLSYGKGVCPSVCLSVTRLNCDKTNESSAEILIPNER